MLDCTLHVGMPKTGTSSIQKTLFLALSDPRFAYFSSGEVTGAQLLPVLVKPSLARPWFWNGRGGDIEYARNMQRKYLATFQRFVGKCRSQGKHLILSGESCSRMSSEDLIELRQLINQHGYKIHVVLYLRPWKSWIESAYQQDIKLATMSGPSGKSLMSLANEGRLDYRSCLENLDHAFGAENVQVRVYSPQQFPNGCVVQDFFRQIGIHLRPESIRRDNDSIGINAVKMLYCYNLFLKHRYRINSLAFYQHVQLTLALREMPDAPFHFHSAYALPMFEKYTSQTSWIENRIGADFHEDFFAFDHGHCIQSPEDFLCFDESSVHWLAQRTKSPIPKEYHGEATARTIADMIQKLRHQLPSLSRISGSVCEVVERSMVRWRYAR